MGNMNSGVFDILCGDRLGKDEEDREISRRVAEGVGFARDREPSHQSEDSPVEMAVLCAGCRSG